MSTQPIAVVVLAAGAGTRMKSHLQKTLHVIGGRSLLSHSLHSAAGITPQQIVAVIGHRREQVGPAVAEVAKELPVPVSTAIQEEQNGTGHAMQCAMNQLADFSGTIVVTYADVPLLRPATLQGLVDAHTSVPTAVTVLTSNVADPNGYGRIVRNREGEVVSIVEQKDADEKTLAITEVNSGVFAFDADVLRQALGQLDANNAQGELYLTDVLSIARSSGHPVRGFRIADAQEIAGVNDRVQLAEAARELNHRTVEAAMVHGATIIDPATTWIDVNVRVGQDVIIHPNTQLHGSTVIADNAVIGPDTTLTNMVVGEGAQVVRTHGSDSEIGPRATVGEESNIGASSVFVNYDGVNKHHTTVGSHVRTGSDTMFIAPVTVGDGAYSGAGTVIREDVPPGALAISGGHQRNIEGWVQAKRPGTPAALAAEEALKNQ